jgi:hypothetical protein
MQRRSFVLSMLAGLLRQAPRPLPKGFAEALNSGRTAYLSAGLYRVEG